MTSGRIGDVQNINGQFSRWWTKDTVAVVTGANRGIGLEIARLLTKLGLTVILTARDEARGRAAVEKLTSQGLNVAFHPLDIANKSSIDDFAKWLQTKYGGLDILVNNAAVAFKENTEDNSVEHAETVINTNYCATKSLTEALLPLFRPSPAGARILNLSSRLGLLNKLENETLRKRLGDVEKLSESEIDEFVKMFLKQVEQGTWKSGGWPSVWPDYSVSKLALNAYSRLLSMRLPQSPEGHKISVNCYCPGFTITSMTKGTGKYTAEEAAQNAAWIVLLPPSLLPNGKFFHLRREASFSKL